MIETIKINDAKELDTLLREKLGKLYEKLDAELDSKNDQCIQFSGLTDVIRLHDPIGMRIEVLDDEYTHYHVFMKNGGELVFRIIDYGKDIGNFFMTIT